ncbi:hypothetical protein KKI90_01690 [Xenorhabdus bovienii]|nr:hypothetical protein [Xenorhabdus bovienii]MDE1485166.1 hypothetical protein [Xenorhabdus bovienii]MDE9477989.1 hypothetical protein [Xenorhabdus bovienii]
MCPFPPETVVAMEACATSHYWGRTLQTMGYVVRLVPTQHVKAFSHHQNDIGFQWIQESSIPPKLNLASYLLATNKLYVTFLSPLI